MRISSLMLLVLSVSLGSCTLEEGNHEQMVNLAEVKDDPAAQLQNLNIALENSRRDGSLYARRAVVLLQNGELEQALQDAEEAVRLTRKEPSTLFVKAQVLRAMGKPEEALPLALAAERNSYQSSSLYVLLGELYLQRKEYKQAMEYIRKAQELSPADEYAFYYKGRVQEATGDTTNAVRNFKLSLEQAPEFMQPQRELAAILVDKGEHEAAKPYLLKALRKAPEDAKLWYNRGLAYQAEQKQDSAMRAFGKAVSINDTLSGAHYRLGLHRLAQGNNDEALEHLEKVYGVYKSDTDYLVKLATAYERVGFFTKALATYQRLVQLDPKATYAYRSISRLKYKIARPIPDSAAVRLQEQIER
ncbi:tetratricopeptide repeat protein [Pontibacter anaerobius]|uniref:Tetratricopeptide repeat protein n=1 Tax=Pontibacter anaerobius TaxID=2993940 RepID=A0ABT3RCB8_9BACT|nr:tetratricopeptide repeat protein [Pontibacter anaerobius]MCX2739170.1 tetratricopeptide repeat protein [Pontibacter anaerobius]